MSGNLALLGVVLLILGLIIYFVYIPNVSHEELLNEIKQVSFNSLNVGEIQGTPKYPDVYPVKYNSTPSQYSVIFYNASPNLIVKLPKVVYSTDINSGKIIVTSGSGYLTFINNSSTPGYIHYKVEEIKKPSTNYDIIGLILIIAGIISLIISIRR
jgi:amino acid permease